MGTWRRVLVLAIVVMTAGCMRSRGGDDDDGGGEGEGEGEGGEGEGEGEGAYQDVLDTCLAAVARRNEVFCSGDEQSCHDAQQFLEWSDGVCHEEMLAWWECLGTSAIYEDCTDDCNSFAGLDCQVAHCQANQDEPECDCSFGGGPGCPPPPPPS